MLKSIIKKQISLMQGLVPEDKIDEALCHYSGLDLTYRLDDLQREYDQPDINTEDNYDCIWYDIKLSECNKESVRECRKNCKEYQSIDNLGGNV